MNTKRTRLAITIITLIAATLILVGCGAPATPAPTAAPQVVKETVVVPQTVVVPATAAPTAPPTAPVVLEFWNHHLAADTKAESEFWDKAAADFNKEYPNILVHFDWTPWDTMWTDYVSSVAAHNPPDMTHAGDVHLIPFAAQGQVVPLDDVLADLGGPDNFSPLLKLYQWEGHTYGLPMVEGGYILFYRKDILQEAGFSEPPKTWDEMVKIAQAITKPDKNFYGIGVDYSAGNGTEQVFASFMKGADAPVMCVGPGGEAKACFDDPKTKAAVQFYTDLGLKYKVVPPGLTAITAYETTATPLLNMFGQGQLGMITFWQLGAAELKAQFPDVWAKTGMALIPAGPSGHSGSFAAANPMWIFKDSKHPEEAKKFIKWLYASGRMCDWIKMSGWISGYNPCNAALASEEFYKVTLAQMPTMSRGWEPKVVDPHTGSSWEAFVRAKVIQAVVVKGMSVDDAVAMGQKEFEKLFSAPVK